MTVGRELARRTGLRLFHNHVAVDPVLRFFEFGTPPFSRLVSEFRRRIFEEVAGSDLPGLIFTFVWAFDLESDAKFMDKVASIFLSRGADVRFVELQADQGERLKRNETALRLQEKWPKRDLVRSRELLLLHDTEHRLHSIDEFAGRDDYMRIDNTHLSPEDVAERIIEGFGLRRVDGADSGPA
jgi:hypothetical protein